MGLYGENDKQGQYWNEQPGQSWVIHDAAMNERCLLYTSPSPRDH